MNWKELLIQSDEFLNDPKNTYLFNLKGHPEFPNLSLLSEDEVLETLSEFIKAEGQNVTLNSMFAYAPFYEQMLAKSNLPSIYG